MDLDVVFLGTSASVPTASRGLSSMLMRRGGESFLFDCGEGTQRQLMKAGGLADIDAIFITHTHADHVLGLPGILKTWALRERTRPLTITGPSDLAFFWSSIQRQLIGKLPYDVEIVNVESGLVWSSSEYFIEAVATDHGVPSLGFSFQEKDRPGKFDVEKARLLGVSDVRDFGVLQRGFPVTLDNGSVVESSDVLGEARLGRHIVYTGDTRACTAIRDISQGATLLVHEATFMQEDAARAHDTKHSTATDAALIALASNAQMLALTHISARYRPSDLQKEASGIFTNTIVMRDFDVIELPFPERGKPRHLVNR